MRKTKLALDVVNDLRNLAESIETLAWMLEGNQSNPVPLANKEEETKEPKKLAQIVQPKLPASEDIRVKVTAF